MVMSGHVVVVDIDVLDEDLVKELLALAMKELGSLGWRRVGQAPKVSLFFRALDAIPTFAGAVIEIFCSAGSKQVLLFGRHPDTGGEYEWEDCSPLSHRLEQMPGVYARQVIPFREQALKLVVASGYIKPIKAQSSRSSFGPSHSVAGIGDMMSEILRAIGVASTDPLVVAVLILRTSPGWSETLCDGRGRQRACPARLFRSADRRGADRRLSSSRSRRSGPSKSSRVPRACAQRHAAPWRNSP